LAVTTLALAVTVEPYGERQRATVHHDARLLAVAVRDGEHDAVEVALTMAAADVAAELCPLRPRTARLDLARQPGGSGPPGP
jgi:hypothetical protein